MTPNEKRTLLDRVLLSILVSILLAGLATVFLGVYALADLVF